jgi:hypothetical protein
VGLQTVTRLEREVRVRIVGWLVALVVALAMLAVVGCVAPEPVRPSTVASELLDAHNAERLPYDLRPLAEDPALVAQAQAWAEHMASTGRFWHSGQGAENIAWNQPDVHAVMAAWLASPGHRANILGRRYTRFGGGMARSRSGQPYWCARFEGAAPADVSAVPSAAYAPPLRDGEMFLEYLDADFVSHKHIIRTGGETK